MVHLAMRMCSIPSFCSQTDSEIAPRLQPPSPIPCNTLLHHCSPAWTRLFSSLAAFLPLWVLGWRTTSTKGREIIRTGGRILGWLMLAWLSAVIYGFLLLLLRQCTGGTQPCPHSSIPAHFSLLDSAETGAQPPLTITCCRNAGDQRALFILLVGCNVCQIAVLQIECR